MSCKERTHKVPREWKNQVRVRRQSTCNRETEVLKPLKGPESTMSRYHNNTACLEREPKPPKEWERAGYTIEHHIVNSCNGGKSVRQNLLVLDESREKAWHCAFYNLSFLEAASKLKLNMIMFNSAEIKAYRFLFKDKTFDEVAEILIRVSRAKNAQV